MGLRDDFRSIKKYMFRPKTVFLIVFIIILALALMSKCGYNSDPEMVELPQESSEVDNIDDNIVQELPPADPTDMETFYTDTLFIGDSRTEGLRMFSGIKNADFFCAKSMSIDKVMAGQSVDVNGKQMSIYDALSEKDYSKVYICLGINELGWTSIEKFISEYENLINEIKSLQENTQIYVELLFPVTKEKSDSDSVVNNSQIYWYNVNIMEMAERNGVKYLNPDKPLIDESGALKAEATTDGVHISSEYCQKWALYLAQITY